MLLEFNDVRVSVLLVTLVVSVMTVSLFSSSTVPFTIQVILEAGIESKTVHTKDASSPATPLGCCAVMVTVGGTTDDNHSFT